MRIRSIVTRAALARGRWAATIGLCAVIALHMVGALPLQDGLRALTFDFYQRVLPRQRVTTPVVIVDIDEASLEKYGPWPWPRNLTAKLLERIWKLEPAAVALDFLMPEADQFSACEITKYVPGIDAALVKRVCALPSNDAVLAATLRRGKAILGVAGVDGPARGALRSAPMKVIGEDPRQSLRRFDGALTNLPQLEDAASGSAILSTDIQDGVVRKIPMLANVNGTVLPSLAVEALRLATGSETFTVRTEENRIEGLAIRDLVIPTQADATLWIHYARHDESRFVSATRVIEGQVDPRSLRNKLVLVGLTGQGLVDVHTTALGERVPGVEIHAEVLESIYDGTTLLRPAWALGLEAALMLVLGLAISWGFPYMRARVLFPVMIGTIALLWLGGLAAYAWGHLLLDVASPTSIFFVMFGFMLVDSLVREELRRKSLTDRLVHEEVHRKALEVDLEAQREEAAKARGEMEAAMRIQMGMLPDVRAQFAREARLDIAARMEPARHVGGDLYDCFMLDADRAYFSIGDVCGKGVPASLFMAISKTLCKSLALRADGAPLEPGELMRLANREISRDNPEAFFVTAFVGVLDLRTGELAYCNAGHDKPLVFAPGSPPAELAGTGGPPVCIVEGFEYASHSRQMAPGEFLCLFTDGVTEAFDRKEQPFGRERLEETLRGWGRDATSERILDAVCSGVRAFARDTDPSDDLTVMVLRWTPSHSRNVSVAG